MSLLKFDNRKSAKLHDSIAKAVYERGYKKIVGLAMTANSTGTPHQWKGLMLTGPLSHSITPLTLSKNQK